MKHLWALLFLLLAATAVRTPTETIRPLDTATKFFLITLDGLRWQEVFQGADSLLLAATGKAPVEDHPLWHHSAAERRKKLLPFFWTVVAKEGQLYGNRTYGNKMNVANPYVLSYPGYNELLTGRVDPFLFGNDKVFNTNPTLLNFLQTTAAFHGKVAAFASWNAFPYILQAKQNGIFKGASLHSPLPVFSDQKGKEGTGGDVRDDRITFELCTESLLRHRPSFVFLSFGGTDEAAHQRDYEGYLQQAAAADEMIGRLWQLVQSLPDYAGRTTFLITTDHGRGGLPANWHTHGLLVPGSSQTWMALAGNRAAKGGEIKNRGQLYQKDLYRLLVRFLEVPE